MEIGFDPEQVFILAKRIEENGARFYRKAADMVESEEARKLLLSLAGWEDEHRDFFESLRTDIHGLEPVDYRKFISRLFAPDDETVRNIQEWADSNIFLPDEDLSDRLKGDESLRDILEMAIQFEKDSIVFYTGLKQAMNVTKESDALAMIIKEEMRHLSVLNRELARCRAKNA